MTLEEALQRIEELEEDNLRLQQAIQNIKSPEITIIDSGSPMEDVLIRRNITCINRDGGKIVVTI